jgi:hypothetical protein
VFPHSAAAAPEASEILTFPTPLIKTGPSCIRLSYVWTTKRSLAWMKFASDYEVKDSIQVASTTTACFLLRWDQKAFESLHNVHFKNG